MVLMKLALESLGDAWNIHATIVLTFGCLNCSFFGSPGAFVVNFLQTLPDKENNYLISGNEQSCRYGAIMIDLTYFSSISVISAYSLGSFRLESKTVTSPFSSLISRRI